MLFLEQIVDKFWRKLLFSMLTMCYSPSRLAVDGYTLFSFTSLKSNAKSLLILSTSGASRIFGPVEEGVELEARGLLGKVENCVGKRGRS